MNDCHSRRASSSLACSVPAEWSLSKRSIISLGHVVISSLTEILVQGINLGVGYIFRFL
ncbi:hypothetical protein RB213_010264, partial [Colletotrichum asianum]